MAQLNFGGVIENVMTREEFPLEKAREILKDETIAVIGYGVQGPGQACNLRDNGFNVIVGQRQGKTYEKAVADGWVPGETLFSIEDACQKGTIVMCLLSDAAVMSVWPTIKPFLTPGKALYFSHGFAITWSDRTGVVPPTDIDVIMVAPKGSGTSLRTMFLEGRGLNSSYAIYQDATGKALDRTLALGIGIGSGYLFETTFIREATSDLTGERGSLMGAIQGLLLAQYEVLRENGHTPSEAFNETIEELTADVFLALWHHAPEMRTEHLTGYLASIARSKGCNWLRKRQLDTQPIDDVVVAADTDISAQAEQAEIVREVMGLLPEQDREILMRYYFYRQTVSEIAGELHMKESTVKTRMYRSRKKLRQLFTERGYGYEQMELV